MRSFGFLLICVGIMVIWLGWQGKLSRAVQALVTGSVPPPSTDGMTVTGKNGTTYTITGNNQGGLNITNNQTGKPATSSDLNNIPAQYREVPHGN
ncbi:hypothetical protein SD51_12175 [Alicyclobacillus tengchongensis]|nr:hypothetical protein SD51_12175 [Alicyclobacillus tengchongensis]